jgi:hypothetical protein
VTTRAWLVTSRAMLATSGAWLATSRVAAVAAVAARQVHAELGPENRRHPDAGLFFVAGSSLGKLGGPVHAVVVSDGERRYATARCLRDQFGGL